MALKSMGVVKNYERIRDFTVAIVGIGGVGVGVCEMLTRCGIGKVLIYDYDTIELANMNKMFYRPEQAGWNKTMAARHYCSELCPDTVFEVHNMDITQDENRAKFKDTIAHGGLDRKSPVNLILGCVDNFAARQVMEALSEELQVPFMDAVVADDAMSGHIQLIIPGRTGGLEQAPIKQHMEKRPGQCAASLATTDSIIAGLMAQNVLKYLLGFGEVSFLFSYNAVTNEFHSRSAGSLCLRGRRLRAAVGSRGGCAHATPGRRSFHARSHVHEPSPPPLPAVRLLIALARRVTYPDPRKAVPAPAGNF
jgi:ubiquitin-like modifier-activating enzyme 5